MLKMKKERPTGSNPSPWAQCSGNALEQGGSQGFGGPSPTVGTPSLECTGTRGSGFRIPGAVEAAGGHWAAPASPHSLHVASRSFQSAPPGARPGLRAAREVLCCWLLSREGLLGPGTQAVGDRITGSSRPAATAPCPHEMVFIKKVPRRENKYDFNTPQPSPGRQRN